MLRINEIFNLHLFKLPRAKNEVARRNFIAKRLALLSDTKWQVRVETIDDVFEISEDTLGGLGAEVRNTVVALGRTNMRFEHHVKRSCWIPSNLPTPRAFRLSIVKIGGWKISKIRYSIFL